MNIYILLLSILLLWNVYTLLLMAIDKNKARKGKSRVSDKKLFMCAFLFGGVGILTGMHIFRHKTKHLSFKIFIPLAVFINIGICYYIIKNL